MLPARPHQLRVRRQYCTRSAAVPPTEAHFHFVPRL